MFVLIVKRIVVVLMALVSLFSASDTDKYADYCGAYDFPRIAAEKQKIRTVRIMSYNIRCADVNGTPLKDRIPIGIRQIKEVMPDSLGIQEAVPEWIYALDKELKLYDWVGVNRETGGSPTEIGESCPIFYLKAKLKLLDSGNFWISETPDVPSFGPGAACKRICTWAIFKNRLSGKTFVHVNTHFDHVSEEARVQGAQIVTRFIEEHFSGLSVVFTADMNTTDKGEAYAVMTQNLNDAAKTAADCISYGTFHGGKDPSRNPDYFIDFVLYSTGFDTAAYRTVTKGIDDRFTSDHFPIYADLQF